MFRTHTKQVMDNLVQWIRGMIVPDTAIMLGNGTVSYKFASRWLGTKKRPFWYPYGIDLDRLIFACGVSFGDVLGEPCNIFLQLNAQDQTKVLSQAWKEVSEEISTVTDNNLRQGAISMKIPIFDLFKYLTTQKNHSITHLVRKLHNVEKANTQQKQMEETFQKMSLNQDAYTKEAAIHHKKNTLEDQFQRLHL
ncbi:hypothetical protein [Holospora curviuscula]|nr:hypothetical protein [Holospora curviuscula]